ncbi:MAG: TetR/AcrR family transcriptional regulator [Gemmobacter sp.]|jgi:TetR/AcrR family transcriptional repressor of bet genes|nr:TetR/AcrR family transcriptional regulator [Gemmobacter sp.]
MNEMVETEQRKASRSRLDSLDRKRDLIDATISVLAEKGYGSFTLAEVAAHAGVSASLIILHFQSKEKLLGEVMSHMGRDYFGMLHASQIGQPDGAVHRLWRLVDAEFSAGYLTPRHLLAWRTFWTEMNGRRDYLAMCAEQTKHFTQLTQALCEEILKDGDYPGHRAWVVARLIDTALGGIWIDLTHGPTSLSIPEARHLARGLLVMFFPRHFSFDGPLM